MSPRLEKDEKGVMVTQMKLFRSVLLVSVGAFAMVFGEFDDSPGLQGIGMILIISVIYFHFRGRRLNK